MGLMSRRAESRRRSPLREGIPANFARVVRRLATVVFFGRAALFPILVAALAWGVLDRPAQFVRVDGRSSVDGWQAMLEGPVGGMPRVQVDGLNSVSASANGYIRMDLRVPMTVEGYRRSPGSLPAMLFRSGPCERQGEIYGSRFQLASESDFRLLGYSEEVWLLAGSDRPGSSFLSVDVRSPDGDGWLLVFPRTSGQVLVMTALADGRAGGSVLRSGDSVSAEMDTRVRDDTLLGVYLGFSTGIRADGGPVLLCPREKPRSDWYAETLLRPLGSTAWQVQGSAKELLLRSSAELRLADGRTASVGQRDDVRLQFDLASSHERFALKADQSRLLVEGNVTRLTINGNDMLSNRIDGAPWYVAALAGVLVTWTFRAFVESVFRLARALYQRLPRPRWLSGSSRRRR